LAIFNPNPPDTQDPSYLGVSKGISDIPADRSGGMLWSGIGDFLENAVTTADTAVKQDITEGVRRDVDATRSQFEAELKGHSQYASLTQPQGQQQGPGVAQSIMPESQPVPPGLDQLEGQLKQLASYRDNGRGSKTLLHGKFESLASEYRARYGGYKDYIDATFRKYTGVDPANAKLDSMIQDYNASVAAAKSESDKMESFFKSKTYIPGMEVKRMQFQRGEITQDDVYSHVAKYDSMIQGLDADAKLRAAKAGRREELATLGLDHGNSIADTVYYTQLDNVSQVFGIKTGRELGQFIKEMQTGVRKIDPVQVESFGQALVSNRTMVREAMEREFAKGGESSINVAIGRPKAQEIINGRMAAYDKLIDDVYNQRWGLLASTKNRADALLDRRQLQILESPNIGAEVIDSAVFQKFGPEFFNKWFEKTLGSADISTKWQAFKNEKQNLAILQTTPDGKGNMNPAINPATGAPDPRYRPRTLKQDTEAARQKGVDEKQVYQSFVDIVNIVKDPAIKDDVAKRNALWYAFDPSNRGSLTNYAEGNSRMRVFQAMTDRKIIDEAYRLGQGNGLWQATKEWVAASYGSEVFRADLQMAVRANQGSSFRIGWDSGNGRLTITDPDGKELDPRAKQSSTYQAVQRINQGLPALQYVLQKDGSTKVEVQLLKFLQDSNGLFTGNPKGIPEQIRDQIIKAHEKPAPAKAGDKKAETKALPYSEDLDPDGSLAGFLKNPVKASGGEKDVPITIGGREYHGTGGIKGNLSDETLVSIDAQNVPEGMSPQEFAKSLKKRGGDGGDGSVLEGGEGRDYGYRPTASAANRGKDRSPKISEWAFKDDDEVESRWVPETAIRDDGVPITTWKQETRPRQKK
jgi:hypothetical protein